MENLTSNYYKDFYKIINYKFNDEKILIQALTHRSFNKNHNERMEFLGDSLLGFIISNYLYSKFKKAKEGELTRIKSSLVRGKILTELAKKLTIHNYIIIGECEKDDRFRNRLLEDSFESLIGAIFLDCQDFYKVEEIILVWYKEELEKLSLKNVFKDSKTLLQEICHKKGFNLPQYYLKEIENKDNKNSFIVSCVVEENIKEIVSHNKKTGEQKLAQMFLEDFKSAK